MNVSRLPPKYNAFPCDPVVVNMAALSESHFSFSSGYPVTRGLARERERDGQ